ncbi:hypothetical protein QMK19_16410 [Streptomyces sp. H10-C2]|nr:hypothetical protein [Streptomyces sp. PH10-H1]MDJ0371224.1 hypothetical protein [Streptomyces sp. H10-C2]
MRQVAAMYHPAVVRRIDHTLMPTETTWPPAAWNGHAARKQPAD